MADDSNPYLPSVGLGIGNAVAQAGQNFVQSYQQSRSNAIQQQQQQQDFQMKQQMYGMQMQKMQQEISPVAVDFAKLNMIRNGVQSGVIPKEMQTYAMKDVYNNIQTPTQAAFANQMLNQHISNSAPTPGHLSLAPNYSLSSQASAPNQDIYSAPSAPNAPQQSPGLSAKRLR